MSCFRVLRNVTPRRNSGEINPDFAPYTDITTTNVDVLMSIEDYELLDYCLWFFLWINRWYNPRNTDNGRGRANPKGNLPEIAYEENGDKYRFFFLTLLKAVVATLAQVYSLMGNFVEAARLCNRYDLAFVHWTDDRSVFQNYFSDDFGGYLDVVILYPHMPFLKGIVCDNETQDLRPVSTANNLVRRINQIVREQYNLETILWMNRFESGGAVNSGLTDIDTLKQNNDYILCIANDDPALDNDGSDVLKDLNDHVSMLGNVEKLGVTIELNNNSDEDYAVINQWIKDNADTVSLLSVWRNGANPATDEEVLEEVELAFDGIDVCDFNEMLASTGTTQENSLPEDCLKIEVNSEAVNCVQVVLNGKVLETSN